jgi:glycosyltransferase involved in cell wall biosynthesis
MTSDLYAHSSFPKERRNALTKVLQEGRFDVVIGVHAFLAMRLATIKKELGNTKTIAWIHNSFEALLKEGSPYLGTELEYHYGRQLKKLDEAVVLYQQDAEMYQKAFGFKPSVIYNPLTLQPGSPSQGNSKRFLAVGRFSYLHKGFDLLIDAFHQFAQKDSEWTLDIVGEGPEEKIYRKKIAQYKLENRIQIHPFTNDIQSYYSQAQVYVLSSRWEGFGLVLVEAMAHGLPVVSSDLPTSKEIMGDFGLYFTNGNIEELAERLHDATQIDWEKKSSEAFTIAHRFDLSKIADQWQTIF